jgi:hypothetical protein
VYCHGTIADHALSLLKAEVGKKGAERLMKNLEPKVVETIEEINPRVPWINEPDCITCHVDYERPGENGSAFNQWTSSLEELYRMRTDNAGIRCEACHNSTHAEYPATNPFSTNRDNFQPLQYSGAPYPISSNASCQVCHKQDMEDPIHHENMLRPFRNIQAFVAR